VLAGMMLSALDIPSFEARMREGRLFLLSGIYN